MRQPTPLRALVVACLTCLPIEAAAQGALADYQRAMGLRDRYQNLTTGLTDQVRWVPDTHKLVYRRTVPGGHEFILVDADTQAKAPAFDHAKLAGALSTALGRTVTAAELPFNEFTFTPDLRRIEFQLAARPGAAPAHVQDHLRRRGAARSTPTAVRRNRVRRVVEAAAGVAAADWRGRCEPSSTSTAPSRNARPTASSRR